MRNNIYTHKAIIAVVIFKCYAEIAIFYLISPTGGDMIEVLKRLAGPYF